MIRDSQPDDPPADVPAAWRRDLAYLKKVSGQLSMELQHTTHDLALARRETKHLRDLRQLERAAGATAAACANEADFCIHISESLVELSLCSRILIVRANQTTVGDCSVLACIGLDPAKPVHAVSLSNPPAFAFSVARQIHPPMAAKTMAVLADFLGMKDILWAHDDQTGFGIAMAFVPAPLTREFHIHFRDLILSGLACLAQGAWRFWSLRDTMIPMAETQLGEMYPSTRPLIMSDSMPVVTELKLGLRRKSEQRVRDVLFVEREDRSFVAFISLADNRGFSLLRAAHNKRTRTFRDVHSMYLYARDKLRYEGVVSFTTLHDRRIGALIDFATKITREDER